MRAHLPLFVVLPSLIAAPLCVLLRNVLPMWLPALVATGAAFVAAVILYIEVSAGATFAYAFGGWQAPWGVAFQVDALNAPLAVLLTFVAIGAVVYAIVSAAPDILPARHPFFYSLLMMCVTGLTGMTMTQDLFNAFVFMEIAALSSYALVGLASDRHSTLAAFRYLIIGAVGTTFFLIGVSYIYMLTGTLNYADIALRLGAEASSRVFLAAVAFIVAGLMMKVALFPLHAWLPAAYSSAPSAVGAFMAAVGVKVSLYLLVRIYFDVLKPSLAAVDLVAYLNWGLVLLSSLAILYGSWQAIRSADVKRLLAFSSIGQIAYITLGVGLATSAGLAAAWIHLFSHALTKGGLFFATGCVLWRLTAAHSDCRVEDLRGLGRRAPWTAAAITVGGLSLIGVPLTAGFVSKWHLVLAIIAASQWWLLAVVLIGSLLAVVYVWRLVEVMYFAEGEEASEADGESTSAPTGMALVSWALIGATIYFGLQASELTRMAARAAEVVL